MNINSIFHNKKMIANEIVEEILYELIGRRGFIQEWNNFDESVQEEIKETLIKLTIKNL